MEASKKNGVIFDMDGTLWDSAKAVAISWTNTLKKIYPEEKIITEEDMKSVMGKTMDVIADLLFKEISKEKRANILEICGEEENDYLLQHGAYVYEGLEETLKILSKRYSLYIVSNCQSGYIEAFLEHYNLRKYIDDIECYGNNNLKKGANIKLVVERNNLQKAVYVGDIQGDYDSSREAGVAFVHAAYGFGEIDDPVPYINKISDLPEVLKNL